MTTDPDEAAFSRPYSEEPNDDDDDSGELHYAEFGLTKREYFACHILAGFGSPLDRNPGGREILVGESVRQADALIAALNRPKD